MRTNGRRGPRGASVKERIRAQRGVKMDEKLAVMCASWLREKFGRNGTVIELKLEEQEEIDRLLNLVVVKFGFVDEDGNVGEGAAFLDVDSVRRVLEMGTQRVGAVA